MKFFELIIDAIYDIVGYIIPGSILILLMLISFTDKNIVSPMYGIFTNINTLEHYFYLLNLNSIYLPFLLMLSYILGHLPKYLSSFVACFALTGKLVNLIIKNLEYMYDDKFNYCIDIQDLVDNKLKNKFNIAFKNEQNYKNFLKTYSSTTSRFMNSKNLIQKYIAKCNFYNSLSCIFFLLFIDSFISSLIIFIKLQNIQIKLILLSILLFIMFKTFYSEFYRHCKLKNKECLLFLYETYIKNETK
ncbi:hypothetical protein P9J83_00675 [Clostridium sporogenes]|uniref:Uncharacterized protein n=1 Tax=Clostridium sporogenes TaxID=1509 RepID=A0AAE4JR30_CLOSG|nr:hypothetical protein [Clostridium sporogenes]MDS1002020.1 hypothetical protein [Clostridium sporogenes]